MKGSPALPGGDKPRHLLITKGEKQVSILESFMGANIGNQSTKPRTIHSIGNTLVKQIAEDRRISGSESYADAVFAIQNARLTDPRWKTIINELAGLIFELFPNPDSHQGQS